MLTLTNYQDSKDVCNSNGLWTLDVQWWGLFHLSGIHKLVNLRHPGYRGMTGLSTESSWCWNDIYMGNKRREVWRVTRVLNQDQPGDVAWYVPEPPGHQAFLFSCMFLRCFTLRGCWFSSHPAWSTLFCQQWVNWFLYGTNSWLRATCTQVVMAVMLLRQIRGRTWKDENESKQRQ